MAKRLEKCCVLCWMVLIGLFGAGRVRAQDALAYPGPPPGPATASVQDDELIVGNEVITCRWSIGQDRIKPISITNHLSGATLSLRRGECFQLHLREGRTVSASDLRIVDGPEIEHWPSDGNATRPDGRQIRLVLAGPEEDLVVQWRIVLRDGSNYVRQHVLLTPKKTGLDLQEVVLVQLRGGQPKAAGLVDGSPVTAGDMFFAFEHPLSKVRTPDADHPDLRCSLVRNAPVKAGDQQAYSSVMGVVPNGQRRRAFLYYIERERAHPYRPFLHYNSWYDIGYGAEKILEPEALKVIELFGKELIGRRNVTMDSFVLDDGWDDPASLWRFHEGFPDGLSPLERCATRYRSAIGAWLSPWGGYGQSKEQRMKYGREQGFETNRNGFSLAGPKYYARFRDACMGMIRDCRLNYFKFDGISSGGVPSGAPAEFAADVEALLRLISDLRRAEPEVFVNVTTGTWPSPYWLWHGDSTWRSGSDWGMHGSGSKRQKQITYRDGQTFRNVVRRAPLYPLNSLMTQGVMFANHGLPDEADGLIEDIRAFFASGTNCQELYITPSLLDAKAWDALAEAARWSRDNADVLVDTHWVGGDPIEGQVYGWASWSRRKGILGLRNPKDTPGRITIDIGRAFELPNGAGQRYSLRSPWKADAATPAIALSAGTEHTFELKPFEVLVFDALPQ